MTKTLVRRAAFIVALAAVQILAGAVGMAATQSAPPIGIVIMHGKGGAPTKFVAELVASLEAKGYLVANLEMPWSGRRDYDATVAEADKEVESALDTLRATGATRLFVAGHSQGGLFALHFGGKHAVDGIIAMAPGGNVGGAVVREKLGESVEHARKLIAAGQGNEKARFLDFESSRGTYPIVCTPAAYLDWFDPDGAMNQSLAVRNVNSRIPVLFVAPKGDYPGLRKVKQAMFDALPPHPLTRLHEPDSSHLGAPSAALDEILRWTAEVAAQSSRRP